VPEEGDFQERQVSKNKKLWGGVFEKSPHALAWQFSRSPQVDAELLPYELRVSRAYVKALRKAKVLSAREASELLQALKDLIGKARRKELTLPEEMEDVHTVVEFLLRKRCGESAERLHLGRSRNDLVVTSTRMWLRDHALGIMKKIKHLQGTLFHLARRHQAHLLPAYTHYQIAQPITLGFHLMAYFWMLQRDGERWQRVGHCANVCPLGSAALAGTSVPLDRLFLAKELGFREVTHNALDAVSDRDFVGEALHASAMLMQHLSRLAQEIVLWSTYEFNFLTLDESLTTGSSIMPQKRNPDVAELVRARSSLVFANLSAYHSLMKGLPLGYHRDMQEDKTFLMQSVPLCRDALDLCNAMLKGAKFNLLRMEQVAGEGFSVATALAERLSLHGVPFRKAHERVGKVVRYCLKGKISLRDLSEAEWKRWFPELVEEREEILRPSHVVGNREVIGGTGDRARSLQWREAYRLWAEKGFEKEG
jgi:argininosuccinate lyase